MEIQKLMKNLLLEDKRSDLFKEFSELPIDWHSSNEEHKREMFDKVWNADSTPTKKYLPWVFKQIVAQNKRNLTDIINITSHVDEYMDYIQKGVTQFIIDEFDNKLRRGNLKMFANEFKKIVQSPKDINSYPDLDSIEIFYHHVKENRSSKDELKLAKENSIKLYEDSNYLIVKPLTYQSSCVYGKETKWCIASRDTSGHWDNYIKNSLFVFVINKKSKDPKYSKFALRVYKKKSQGIEVWDQQDVLTTFDVLYEKMPGIQPILSDVLKISTGDYFDLMLIKEKKQRPEVLFATNPNIDVSSEGELYISFEDFEDFANKILKSSIEDWELSMLIAINGKGYHDYEYYDAYQSKEEISQGYVISSLNSDNLELLDRIANILNPKILSKKHKLDEREYFELLGEMISSEDRLLTDLAYEHSYAMNIAIEKGIEESIEKEFCDLLSMFNIKEEKCFKEYVTTVDNMLSLYERYGKKENSIFKVLRNAVEYSASIPSLFESYYEIYDDDLFYEKWNGEAGYILEKYLDKLLEDFDDNNDIDEYQRTIEYVVKNFGFNVEKEIPSTPGQHFSILGVLPNSKITVAIRKGEDVFKANITIQQLETILKNYKLFDIV